MIVNGTLVKQASNGASLWRDVRWNALSVPFMVFDPTGLFPRGYQGYEAAYRDYLEETKKEN